MSRLPTLADNLREGRERRRLLQYVRPLRAVLHSAELAARALAGRLICSSCGSRDVGVQRYDPGPRRRAPRASDSDAKAAGSGAGDRRQ